MQCMILKTPEGGVIIKRFVHPMFFDEEHKLKMNAVLGFHSVKKYLDLGYEYSIEDFEGIRKLQSQAEHKEQLVWDEQGIWIDKTWDKILMPDWLIRKKAIDKLDAKIEEKFKAEISDAVEIVKLQREFVKLKELQQSRPKTCKKTLLMALKGLDERVVNGESDKPVIRQKLQQKIQELGE